jgi:hypothetical protein
MVDKGSGLKKFNTLVWLIAGILTIFLTIYTFFIMADLQTAIP